MASDFTIRLGELADHPMVFKTTAVACRWCPYYTDLDRKAYSNMINEVVGTMLTRWTLIVAFVTKVPSESAGYVLFKPGVALGTIFVKPDYRRRGVGRMLLETARLRQFPTVLASPRALRLAREKGLHVQFSPYFGILEGANG